MSLWRFIFGGDGFEFEVDPANPIPSYAESQNLNLGRSDNKGVSFAGKSGGIMEADPGRGRASSRSTRVSPAGFTSARIASIEASAGWIHGAC